MSEVEQEQGQEQETQEQDGPEHDAAPTEETDAEEAAEAGEVEGQEGESAEGAPPEPQALSQKQMERALDKLDREAKRHRGRVEEIMGEDAAMLLDCPMCDSLTPGQIMPTPATPERFPSVRQFMGDAQPAEYQQDPNTRTCQTCAGEGVVSTGSKVNGQAQLVCTDCGGKGWQGARPAPAMTGPMAVPPSPDANGQDTPMPQGPEPPEAAKLRALGYTLIQPVGSS